MIVAAIIIIALILILTGKVQIGAMSNAASAATPTSAGCLTSVLAQILSKAGVTSTTPTKGNASTGLSAGAGGSSGGGGGGSNSLAMSAKGAGMPTGVACGGVQGLSCVQALEYCCACSVTIRNALMCVQRCSPAVTCTCPVSEYNVGCLPTMRSGYTSPTPLPAPVCCGGGCPGCCCFCWSCCC